jgi:hypothetical protein
LMMPPETATTPTGEPVGPGSTAPSLDGLPQSTPLDLYPVPTDTLDAVMTEVLPMSAAIIPAVFVPPTSDVAGVGSVIPAARIELTEEPPLIVNPEPGTMLLFGTGLVMSASRVRRWMRTRRRQI